MVEIEQNAGNSNEEGFGVGDFGLSLMTQRHWVLSRKLSHTVAVRASFAELIRTFS
jgi:hypothetical protein